MTCTHTHVASQPAGKRSVSPRGRRVRARDTAIGRMTGGRAPAASHDRAPLRPRSRAASPTTARRFACDRAPLRPRLRADRARVARSVVDGWPCPPPVLTQIEFDEFVGIMAERMLKIDSNEEVEQAFALFAPLEDGASQIEVETIRQLFSQMGRSVPGLRATPRRRTHTAAPQAHVRARRRASARHCTCPQASHRARAPHPAPHPSAPTPTPRQPLLRSFPRCLSPSLFLTVCACAWRDAAMPRWRDGGRVCVSSSLSLSLSVCVWLRSTPLSKEELDKLVGLLDVDADGRVSVRHTATPHRPRIGALHRRPPPPPLPPLSSAPLFTSS